MITEYESEGGAAVAMFATYTQLGSELAALLRELQYTREHAADRARDAADAQRENARLRVYVSELEALIGGDQRAAAVARALVRHDGGGQ